MSIRVAAIGVSHWHSLYDAAYLRHLVAMPDVRERWRRGDNLGAMALTLKPTGLAWPMDVLADRACGVRPRPVMRR